MSTCVHGIIFKKIQTFNYAKKPFNIEKYYVYFYNNYFSQP